MENGQGSRIGIQLGLDFRQTVVHRGIFEAGFDLRQLLLELPAVPAVKQKESDKWSPAHIVKAGRFAVAQHFRLPVHTVRRLLYPHYPVNASAHCH
ncbi:hypothetical protein D3C81_1988660 [compost metagenome]